MVKKSLKFSLILYLFSTLPATALQDPKILESTYKTLLWNEKIPTNLSQQKYGLVINSLPNSILIELDGCERPYQVENIPKNLDFKTGDTLVCYLSNNYIKCQKLEVEE